MKHYSVLLPLIAALAACSTVTTSSQTFAHFEGRQTHPIAFTPGATRLLALNTPDARLSVFDVSNATNAAPTLLSEIPVGLEPVSVRARTEDEVWVVNEVSDTITVLSLSLGRPIATLACPDEPADVAFAQGYAFVTCARNNLLRVFNATNFSEVATIPLQGLNPRALTVGHGGTNVYIAFQLSGNRTTILPASAAPPQPAPWNTNLPAAPQTSLIVPASDSRIAYTVLDQDVAEVSASQLQVLRYFSDTGTSLFDVSFRPGSQEIWVANTEALNLIKFEPNLKGHFADNRLTRINLLDGAATAFDLNPGTDHGQLPNPDALAISLAQPTALVFSADGATGWLAAFASDRVAKFDATNGNLLARVDVRLPAPGGVPNDSRFMRGPRGLAWHEARQRLYVLNKLANSLSVIDTTSAQVIAELPVGSGDPTPEDIRQGRGFLFDARLSGNGSASCGTCHLDGDRDGLAWDLGDPNGEMVTVMGANLAAHDTRLRARVMHPMKGPMMTQTLRGLATNQLLHWRGDRAALTNFNPTFPNLMGGPLISDGDMGRFKKYLDTLRHHPNPNRKLDNAFPATFNGGNPTRGRPVYNLHLNHCGVCHVLPSGTDNNVDDLRNVAGTQSMKTPSLQTVYQRAVFDSRPGATNLSGFGLAHDGTGGSQTLPTVHFYELDELVGPDFADVTAFLMCFDTGVAPAVGFNRTVTVSNATDSVLNADLALLEGQARSNACDIVVRGRLTGQGRHFNYDKVSQRYGSDRSDEPLRTRAELLGLLGAEDSLSFLGTLPGTGKRFGNDRNGNGTLDGDEPSAPLTIAGRDPGVVLSWPDPSLGWLLEQAPSAHGPWKAHLQSPAREGDQKRLQHPILEEPAGFFRLRRTW